MSKRIKAFIMTILSITLIVTPTYAWSTMQTSVQILPNTIQAGYIAANYNVVLPNQTFSSGNSGYNIDVTITDDDSTVDYAYCIEYKTYDDSNIHYYYGKVINGTPDYITNASFISLSNVEMNVNLTGVWSAESGTSMNSDGTFYGTQGVPPGTVSADFASVITIQYINVKYCQFTAIAINSVFDKNNSNASGALSVADYLGAS
ncbi:MAG: hypothetical protein FWD71_08060 [Oscillospiraceae bacterium]|nr:hypothetical protein [Oscillospiraceae bacterium]